MIMSNFQGAEGAFKCPGIMSVAASTMSMNISRSRQSKSTAWLSGVRRWGGGELREPYLKPASKLPQSNFRQNTSKLVVCSRSPRGRCSDLLRLTGLNYESEAHERRSSVRTNAGRNKKWRTLGKGGRIEGNKRARDNDNTGQSKSQSTGPQKKVDSENISEENINQEDTETAAKIPKGKPKQGPKPRERVTWAGQKMLLLNPGERFKIGQDVTPWESNPSQRMPDDYYKYGPFGPHAWKGVCVGTPRRGTVCDNNVVFFSSVRNEEEHEQGAIQDAITGYSKRVDQMDESVGVQYYFAFVRQVQKLPSQPPWKEWTLVAQVAVESGADLDKWRLGFMLDRKMREQLTHCVGWFRPDLIYVKRPAYQVRFEPQKEFLEGLLKLLNPDNEPEHDNAQSYFEKLCELLGVDVKENSEQAGTAFDKFSEETKMECVEHVLTNHPVCLLTPFTNKIREEDLKQNGGGKRNTYPSTELESEHDTIGVGKEEIDWMEDEILQNAYNEEDEDFEPELEEVFGRQHEEDLDSDEQDDSRWTGNEWEREVAKALAAEAAQDSPNAQPFDVDDDEYLNEQVVQAYSKNGTSSRKGEQIAAEQAEITEKQHLEPFLDAAVRPYTYTNLIKEIFIIRKALVDYPALRT